MRSHVMFYLCSFILDVYHWSIPYSFSLFVCLKFIYIKMCFQYEVVTQFKNHKFIAWVMYRVGCHWLYLPEIFDSAVSFML